MNKRIEKIMNKLHIDIFELCLIFLLVLIVTNGFYILKIGYRDVLFEDKMKIESDKKVIEISSNEIIFKTINNKELELYGVVISAYKYNINVNENIPYANAINEYMVFVNEVYSELDLSLDSNKFYKVIEEINNNKYITIDNINNLKEALKWRDYIRY